MNYGLKSAKSPDMKVKTVDSLSYPVTLGRESFHNGKISFETIEKICQIIKGFLNTASEYGVKHRFFVIDLKTEC